MKCFCFSPALKYFVKYSGKVLHRLLACSRREQSFNRDVQVPFAPLTILFKALQNTKDDNQKTLETKCYHHAEKH